jgi:AsmA-like C-terminal region
MRGNLSPSLVRRLGVALGALAILAVLAHLAFNSLPAFGRRILIADLQQRFHSAIEIGEIHIHGVMPLTIVARHITLRYHGRSDVPPLMTIEGVTASAELRALWKREWRVRRVHLEGLRIHIPPRQDNAPSYVAAEPPPTLRLPAVEFDEVTADNALLEILPRQSQRKPHSFWIHHLTLRSVTRGNPVWFHAQLTNAVPTGEIDSQGALGPWNPDQPSLTPLAANFHFANADLSQFRGLSGTLSSAGHYAGVLERLEVEGEARVSNFNLSLGGKPIMLATRYLAVVDGTNGNTYLKTVDARFLRTTLTVKGEIIDPPGAPQRRIVLAVDTRNARAEDVLQLVTKAGGIPLQGALKLHARFELPSGSADLVDRLSLSAHFEINGAIFENPDTQEKLDALSRRGQGQPGNPAVSDVFSDLRGDFQVRAAQASFSNLEFRVPGALVSLRGSYGLRTEAIDLRGHLQLASRLSHTTTGVKSALLRILDPLFKDGLGGSILPIKITGSRSNPSFALDLRRRLKPAGDPGEVADRAGSR